jgi:hypothetical protein
MTNYGIKFNEKDRDLWELEQLTHPTPEQIKAKATLRYLMNGRPSTRNSDPLDVIPNAPARWPWEPRPAGHVHAEYVPPMPRWLRLELSPPWWRRLWRWIDPRKQFRDWDER